MNVVVKAETVGGRLIDPIRWAGSGNDQVELSRIVVKPGLDVFWVDYVSRIANMGVYHNPLGDWIRAHHTRTGNPNDRIRRFEVYVITQNSPPPGETNPRDFKAHSFFRWEAPRR